MIEVHNLTKRYGQHVALDGVSFSVGCGEVVGFLGPNGAGKSTTMRILTTFMAAPSGSVRVGGDAGDPVVVSHPDSALARAFTDAAGRVAQRLAIREHAELPILQ